MESLCALDANAAACTLYGYSRAEMVGISAKELRPAEEVDRFQEFVAQKVIQGDAGNWMHTRKDGTNFTVNIRYHAIEYNGRKARFVIVTPAALTAAG